MRALRRLIIALVILCALFVAADRIAVGVADSQVASKLQTSRGLAQKPSVSIGGFPFLTQLIGGKLDDVKVRATDMAVQGTDGGPSVTLQTFDADLKGVRLTDGYTTAVADTGTGTATISYADLSAALPNHPTVGYGGDGKVKVSGTVDIPILGAQQVSGTAHIAVVSGDTIGITDISGLSGVDAAAASLVNAFLEPQYQLQGLPAGLKLTQIQAEPNGVSIGVSGTNVVLNNNGS
jgi:hypothetical protein